MRFALVVVFCLAALPLAAQPDGTTDIKVVTGRGSYQDLMDAPDAVSLLMQKQIHERMFGQAADLLEGSTGVFMQHTAAGQASPFIRGRTGKEIIMLVNGVRFNTSTFRSGPNQYYSSLDPSTIERIEVVRGPASVLYGSDAMGGVVNFILRQPRFNEFEYSFGTRGRFESASTRKEAGLFGEVHTQGFSGLVNATYADVDELVGGDSIGRQPFTAYEEWGTFGNFGGRAGHHTLNWMYSHFQQNDVNRTDAVSGFMPNQAVLPAPGVGNDLRRLFTQQVDDFTVLTWTWAPLDTFQQLQVDTWYHRQAEVLERVRRSSPTRIEETSFNTHSLGIKAQAIFLFSELARLTVGAEGIHDMVQTRSVDTNADTDVQTNGGNRVQFPDWSSYTSVGLYAQNETSLIDDMLQLRYGMRYSFYRALSDVDARFPQFQGVNNAYSDLTGALAIVGRPIEQLALTLNLARGFRAPNLDDLAASKAFGGGQQFPNPDVDPESQYSIDLGARVFMATSDKDSAAPYDVLAHAVFFFNYLEDLLVSEAVTLNGVNGFHPVNAGRGRIFGVEAEFGFNVAEVLGWFGAPTSHVFFEGDALSVYANFTYTRGDDLKNDVPISRIPPVFSEIAIRYEVNHGAAYMEPYMTIVGRQDQYAPNAANDSRFTPHDEAGYVLFGLRTGWTPSRHVRLNLGVQNIGNRSYHPLGSGTYGSGTNVMLSGEIRW